MDRNAGQRYRAMDKQDDRGIVEMGCSKKKKGKK